MIIKIRLWACLMTCLFFAISSFATIIKDEKSVTGRKTFSYTEVCENLTKRKSPLIDFKSISSLSCMGEIKQVAPFCDLKEAANPYYIRAIVLQETKQVECLSAKKVVIKYACDGKDDKHCLDSEIGCFMLREKLAKRLQTTFDSFTDNKKYLNCYFEVGKKTIDLPF